MSPSFGYILNMAAADVFMLLHLESVSKPKTPKFCSKIAFHDDFLRAVFNRS